MKRYLVPVQWRVEAHVVVAADNPGDAVQRALSNCGTADATDAAYIDDSWRADEEPEELVDVNERNEERADRAESALLAYKNDILKERGQLNQETIVDFLTDLRHLAARSPDLGPICQSVRVSEDHFFAEHRGDE